MKMRERDARNLNPHKSARAAMWLYGHAYAAQSGGSMDFWDSLPEYKKRLCRDMVDAIERADVEPERGRR
jgi:hypothetical protein